jgi:hypothetical protein
MLFGFCLGLIPTTPWVSFCIFSPAEQAAKLDHWAALGKKQARPLKPTGVGKKM